jgi:hypothetical protein
MEIEVEKETIADTFNTYHGGRPSVRASPLTGQAFF